MFSLHLQILVGHAGEHGARAIGLPHPAAKVAQQVGATQGEPDDDQDQPLQLEGEEGGEEEEDPEHGGEDQASPEDVDLSGGQSLDVTGILGPGLKHPLGLPVFVNVVPPS